MDAIIVGGGIAGLTCAHYLQERGKSFVLLEATDRVGGRIATDVVDGFLLDRGFQVFLTAYPEAKRILDYDALKLAPFEPGALIRHGGALCRLVDPWRRPQHLFATALSPAASFGDKLKVAKLRKDMTTGTYTDSYQHAQSTTMELLRRRGFSDIIIERFFKPFLGGIFLEPDLKTSSRMFEFVFRMFSEGDACLPAAGMQEIPKQIAARLPADSVRLNSKVAAIDHQSVTLTSGEALTAKAVVLATENPSAATLSDVRSSNACGVTCVYFAVDKPLINEAILLLNGDSNGPINNLCLPNLVVPEYAPSGQFLVSVTVLGTNHGVQIHDRVQRQLAAWFGPELAKACRHLRTYEIPFALPSQTDLDPVVRPARLRPGLYRCSDDCDTASINGAMAAGRRAAEAIVEDMSN